MKNGQGGYLGRAYFRIFRIPRTIADVEGEPHLPPAQVAEAI